MNLQLDKLIEKFQLEQLDYNPLLINLQCCLRKLALHYKLENRFKINRPSYIFIILIGIAIILTIVKLFQTLVIMMFILIRGYLSVKLIIQKIYIRQETQSWIFLGFLLLFNQFLGKIDIFSPFIQIFIYNIPWFQEYKYSNQIFESLKQVSPELFSRQHKKLDEDEFQNKDYTPKYPNQPISFNRMYLRM